MIEHFLNYFVLVTNGVCIAKVVIHGLDDGFFSMLLFSANLVLIALSLTWIFG